MARQETDPEDLFSESTALVRRAELAGRGLAEPVVVGFRRDGGLSVYFGPDPAYHFDPAGRLKRAYRGGRLYRTQGETLAELTRERTPKETALRRRDLRPEECEAFLAEMVGRVTSLGARRGRGEVRVTRQFPEADATFWTDFDAAAARMKSHEGGVLLLAPRFKGKR